MMLIRNTLTLSLIGPALVLAQDMPFEAPPLQPSQMDFGGVGLIQMPTGRMAPEGEFNVAVNFSKVFKKSFLVENLQQYAYKAHLGRNT